jgi:myo-inositol-1(or 4)-monophosphatase
MNRFLEEAKKIVLIAGKMAKELPLDSRVLIPKEHGQFYTQGDLDVEKYITNNLKERFPDHGFDSEEMGKKNTEAEYVWFLDPIDGTSYYAKDVPFYSISLALAYRDKFILGVVYCPELDRMYCASIGKGPTLNGHKICCSSENDLEKASICLEIPSKNSSLTEIKRALGKMSMLIQHSYRVRIIGVGSLGMCFCAAGGFDAYVNLGSMWKCHDIAAGQVIVQEAGGEFSIVGKDKRQIVAGPAALCKEIQALVNL